MEPIQQDGAKQGDREIELIQVAAMLKAEAVRARCVAFAMEHREWMGAGPWVQGLDTDVMQMVLAQV